VTWWLVRHSRPFSRVRPWRLAWVLLGIFCVQGFAYTFLRGSYWLLAMVVPLALVYGLVVGEVTFRQVYPPVQRSMLAPKWTGNGLPPPGLVLVTCDRCGRQGMVPAEMVEIGGAFATTCSECDPDG